MAARCASGEQPTVDEDPLTARQDSGSGPLRRRNHRNGELAYYRCYSLTPAPLAKLVRAFLTLVVQRGPARQAQG